MLPPKICMSMTAAKRDFSSSEHCRSTCSICTSDGADSSLPVVVRKSRIVDQPLWKLKQEIYTNHFRTFKLTTFAKKNTPRSSLVRLHLTSFGFVSLDSSLLIFFFTILFHFTPPSFLSSLRSLRHSSSVK